MEVPGQGGVGVVVVAAVGGAEALVPGASWGDEGSDGGQGVSSPDGVGDDRHAGF